MGREGAGNDIVEIKVHPRRENNVGSPPPYQNKSVFKKWVPWLVPLFVVSNIAVFIAVMYVNDCPTNSSSCAAPSLGRFSFQPLKENPLLGPSSSTWAPPCYKHYYWSQCWLAIFGFLFDLFGFLLKSRMDLLGCLFISAVWWRWELLTWLEWWISTRVGVSFLAYGYMLEYSMWLPTCWVSS